MFVALLPSSFPISAPFISEYSLSKMLWAWSVLDFYVFPFWKIYNCIELSWRVATRLNKENFCLEGNFI